MRLEGFRVEGFRGLGFRVEGFRGLGFRVEGFRVYPRGSLIGLLYGYFTRGPSKAVKG